MSVSNGLWTPEAELALYMAMVGLRPVGIHKNFRIVNIYTRLLSRLGSAEISISEIKSRLETLFNMSLLDEIDDEEDDDSDDEESDVEHADAGAKPTSATSAANRIKPDKGDKVPVVSADDGSEDEEANSGSESEDSGSDINEPSSARSGHRVGTERKQNIVGSAIPATSIGAEIDTSDPQFWRKADSEFTLPWAEFGNLMVERANVDDPDDHDDLERGTTSGASAISTPKTATPAPDSEPKSEAEAEAEVENEIDGDGEGEVEVEVEAKDEGEGESSDGRVSPVQRKRKGRPSTPVSRSRTKSTRSSTASARKRQKTR
ncbi:hypothetical protein LPJ66_006500 [Kickxella alabastrina]|uniref:Uncharacterized protein n=1 Tax=Kickxella alabastrina TaxID=61397 RepID=A0ACC1IBQ9_9FUNG|nr:hypothetical protein LPJ66_006500 [Kickxella alabastrina]